MLIEQVQHLFSLLFIVPLVCHFFFCGDLLSKSTPIGFFKPGIHLPLHRRKLFHLPVKILVPYFKRHVFFVKQLLSHFKSFLLLIQSCFPFIQLLLLLFKLFLKLLYRYLGCIDIISLSACYSTGHLLSGTYT